MMMMMEEEEEENQQPKENEEGGEGKTKIMMSIDIVKTTDNLEDINNNLFKQLTIDYFGNVMSKKK